MAYVTAGLSSGYETSASPYSNSGYATQTSGSGGYATQQAASGVDYSGAYANSPYSAVQGRSLAVQQSAEEEGAYGQQQQYQEVASNQLGDGQLSSGYDASAYSSPVSAGYAGQAYSGPMSTGYASQAYSSPVSTGYASQAYSSPVSSGYANQALSSPVSSGYANQAEIGFQPSYGSTLGGHDASSIDITQQSLQGYSNGAATGSGYASGGGYASAGGYASGGSYATVGSADSGHSQVVHTHAEAVPISKHVEITRHVPVPITQQIHVPGKMQHINTLLADICINCFLNFSSPTIARENSCSRSSAVISIFNHNNDHMKIITKNSVSEYLTPTQYIFPSRSR